MRIHRRCLLCLSLSAAPLLSQSAEPVHSAPTLKVNVREVTVDVAVYDGNGYTSRGAPVSGLHKEDFEVLEGGKPQTIRSFEEHTISTTTGFDKKESARRALIASPVSESKSSLTVILIDTASTDFEAQPWMLQQLADFVKSTPSPGPIALFALTPGLRVLHGFTTDPAQLLAALESKSHGLKATPSPFLETTGESDLAARPAAIAKEAASEHPSASGAQMADQLERLRTTMLAVQAMQRTSNTLDAFQQIARYLAVFPGRKNLIWLGSSFTDRPFGLDTEPDEQFRKTADLLQAARIAVYPIDAKGLVAPGNSAAPASLGVHDARTATSQRNDELAEASLGRNALHGTMDEIAERTGGEAYYNTNGLAWAMNRIVTQADQYYSFVYTPNDWSGHTGYRKIHVRLVDHHGSYRLSYRRGYFAEDSVAFNTASDETTALDPFMDANIPTISQILFKMSIQPSSQIEQADAALGGRDRKMLGSHTHYTCNLAIAMKDLKFTREQDGLLHGDFILDLVAYSDQGKPISWTSKRFTPAVQPAVYAHFEHKGIQLSEQLDLPRGKYLFRAGVYDVPSKKVGALDALVDNTR